MPIKSGPVGVRPVVVPSNQPVVKAPSTSPVTAPGAPSAQAWAPTAGAQRVAAVGTGQPIVGTPTVAHLEGLRSGSVQPAAVAWALREALTSGDPAKLAKAAQTLQVAESYQRKAQQDATNYAGTGFVPFTFPKLEVKLSAEQTAQLINQLATAKDKPSIAALHTAAARGLLVTEPRDALGPTGKLAGLAPKELTLLPGSDGREAPRGGAKTFQEDWTENVVPGLANIKEAIIETAKARGPSCPYARGNHAKGVSFDDASFKVDKNAPPWAKDLFGDGLEGGMVRISGSQTNPDQPDSEAHMPGIRLVFPVNGALDGSATSTIDLTANTGDTTHAQTAAEHTRFTQDISVPKRGLSNLTPVRAAKHVLGGLFGAPGGVPERIRQMKNAVEVTGMANAQRFDEHEFFGRHAFFVGGRYVQVRFEVVEPKPFPDASKDPHPDARLNAVSKGIAEGGLKLAMFVTELPGGNPDLVEQEGWKGLPETRLATITVPPQQQTKDSRAAKWFDEVSHVPGGDDKVFQAAGLGRHRVPVYLQSEKVRHSSPN